VAPFWPETSFQVNIDKGVALSALTNGFRIVESITATKSGMTFSQIVAATGLPKASVHRLLKELVELSALTFDDTSRRYAGGLLLAGLGASVTANYDVRQIARPHLEALHEITGSVATLGIRDGEKGIYIDKIEPASLVIRLHSEIGKSFPLHCTAMGKVLLSYADEAVVRRLLNRKLEAHTANTITDPKQLREELEQVRNRGFAIDDEEITRGVVCVAAPIFGIDGRIAGAMSCTVPTYVSEERGLQGNIEAVCRLSKQASSGASLSAA
jgi:DNA-binding IclR family transcriptional regulator